MEIIEGKLYFIKDEFIEKYNPKYHLMENKEVGTKRPTYFCFRDKKDKNILWFVPMSSKYDKYLKIYEEIDRKTRDIFVLTNKGIVTTFTNLPEFIKDIKNELK